MNQLFSGQTRTRPSINLSGTGHDPTQGSASASSSNPSSSVSERARQERLARESHRRLDSSARRIQVFWRAQHNAGLVRNEIRHELDQMLAKLANGSSADMVQATTRLAFVFRSANKADLARLSSWARLAATGKPKVRLFQPFFDDAQRHDDTGDLTRWKYALAVLSLRMIQLAATDPA